MMNHEALEDCLKGYKKDEAILSSRIESLFCILAFVIICAYLLLGGLEIGYAVCSVILIIAVGIYKIVRRRCRFCGGKCNVKTVSKKLDSYQLSFSSENFKIIDVVFCERCRKYAQLNEHESS
jgi:hypothetical protein